jgi:hypothetical protein
MCDLRDLAWLRRMPLFSPSYVASPGQTLGS